MTIAANVAAVNKTANTTGQLANSSNTGLTNSLESLASNFTNFISLLTTQLKNQDPTSPMETNEFTQELIGFSQVQQQVESNTNLSKLLEATKASNVNNSIGYINQLIQAETDKINLKVGKAIPEAEYELPKNAKTSVINIVDSTGTVVKSFNGNLAAGKHKLTWDGKNNQGDTVQAGTYKIQITAVDADGKDITGIKTNVTDYVSQVDFANGQATLYFGDVAITTDKILSVKGYFSQEIPVNPPADETETETSNDDTNTETPAA